MSRIVLLLLSGILLALCVQAQDNPMATLPAPGVSPVILDRTLPQTLPSSAGPPAWQILTRMSTAQRANARVQLSMPPGVSADLATAARSIEAAWDGGDYDRALDALAALSAEKDVRPVETTIIWRTPVEMPLAKLSAGNVQIGAQDTISAVDVVCDASNQQLFAILAFHSSPNDGYELVKSTDGGTTWGTVSTNSFSPVTVSARTVSIAYVNNMVRVIYLVGNGSELRWRQYDNSGSPVSFPAGSAYISLAGPGASPTVKEAKLFSNNLSLYNNRLYYATILSDHTAHMYWAYADSAFFTPLGSTSHALQGLSGVGGAYTSNLFFVSYIDTANNLCIDSVSGATGNWGHKRVVPGYSATSLGYYMDTVVCAHDVLGSVLYCMYEISSDGGRTWNSGGIDSSTVTHEYPAICMDKGQGMAIIYRYYTPTRQGRIIARQYKGPGVWSTPVSYTSYQPYPLPAAITALGGNTWGMVYVSWTPPYNAYFATYKNTLVAVGPASGNLPVESTLFQNFPNPFNPVTTIRFQLPGSSDVRLTVYDILGRGVSVLVNERRNAGVYEVRFDGSNLASGVCFYRLQAGSFVSTKKLLLLR